MELPLLHLVLSPFKKVISNLRSNLEILLVFSVIQNATYLKVNVYRIDITTPPINKHNHDYFLYYHVWAYCRKSFVIVIKS